MGSCENSISLDEPVNNFAVREHLCPESTKQAVSEQILCLDDGGNSVGSDVDTNNNASDRHPDSTGGVNIDCVVSGDVTESKCSDSADGLVGECENVGGLGAENSLNESCRVSGACLEEDMKAVDSNATIDVLCLENADCLGLKTSLDGGQGAGKDLLEECRSVVDDFSAETRCLCSEDGSKNLQNDVCGLNGDNLITCMGDPDDCKVETDQLCLGKGKPRGEDGSVTLLKHCKMPCAVMPTNGFLLDCIRREEQNDEKSVSGLPGDEKLLDDGCGASGDCLIVTKGEAGDSKVETPQLCLECVQEEEQKGGTSISVLPEEGSMEKKSNCLASFDTITHFQSSSSKASAETVVKVTEEQSNFLEKGRNDGWDIMIPSYNCEMPSESMPVTCSMSSVQQDGQKDDKSTNCHSVEIVMGDKADALPGTETDSQMCEVQSDLVTLTGSPRNRDQQDKHEGHTNIIGSFMEGEGKIDLQDGNIDFLARKDTGNCVPTSHFLGSLMPLNLAAVNGTQGQQNEQIDPNTCSALAAESGVNGKNDTLCENKADMSDSKSFSQDGLMPSRSSRVHDLVCTSDGNTNHKSDSGLDGGVVEVVAMKSVIENVIVALPAQDHQKSLKNLHMVDKLTDCAQDSEQSGDSVVPSEIVTWSIKEKSDITKVNCSTEVSLVEANTSNSNNGSCGVASSCSVEKSVSLNCSGHMEIKDDLNIGVDRVSETKCPGIVSSSSRRSSCIGKSKKKTATKGTARNSRNKAKVSGLCQDTEIIFKAARRKRSRISRQARSSLWGLLRNVVGHFGQCDGLKINQSQNQGLLEVKVGRGSGKRNKNQASGSSRVSRRKCHTSNSCLRLRVKLGKDLILDSLNAVVSEVVDASAPANAIHSDRGADLELSKLDSGVVNELDKEETERHFQSFNKNLENIQTCSDASLAVHVEGKDLEGSVITDKFAGDAADDCLGLPSHTTVEALDGVTENGYMDPGTSPDSEVINIVPDAQVGARCQEDLQDAILNSSKSESATGDVTRSKRGKKKDKLPRAAKCNLKDGKPGSASINKTKSSKKRGGRQKMDSACNSSEGLASSTSTGASSNSLSASDLSVKPLPLTMDADIGNSGEALNKCSSQKVSLGISEAHNSNGVLPSTKSEGHQISKNLKSNKASKGRSKVSDSGKSRKRDASRQKGNQGKLFNKSKVKPKVACNPEGCTMDGCTETGNQVAEDIRNRNAGDDNVCIDRAKMDKVSGGVMEQSSPADSAWVSCDDCFKWRRISVELADSLGETCRWVCKDNIDKAYASCSIPQEKSNADINAELGISDADEEACDGHLNYKGSKMGLDYRHITVPQKSCFKRIDTNEFLHRSRKTQTIDEIMVCHCKAPSDGQLGCGDECLNRMLNIECVPGTCPCGDHCSNQQFQKRKYADMQWSRCGKKGYGLKVLEDISRGQFLIEYVGEVLDMHAYEERQKEYALNGHKHFYFMTLNGSEVIDACAKGNLGRFINHSCDPNCRTEKWMVNGEICVGLFALRDIKKEEEITFDYNYVRVFGAAAKKCYCGSPYCRGYIGGDPLNTEAIVQGDSDDEYPEPVMLEDGETCDVSQQVVPGAGSSNATELQIPHIKLEDRGKAHKFTTAVGQLEITPEPAFAGPQLQISEETENLKGKIPSVQPPEVSIPMEDVTSKHSSTGHPESIPSDETTDKTSSAIQKSETSATMMHGKSSSDGKRIFRKSRFLLKASNSSGSVKKGKVSSNPLNGNKVKMIANKPEVLPVKPKKVVEGSSSGRFEAVQEKLNELLNVDGGISKRKDAPKGYLKLLLLTAASGDSGNSEAIQSNRDLSMILDALLKTKSRVVLIDIINKNGLQMLHNMMKQYRRNFKKIPILRKLLKVLEYLAAREILTLERIIGGPPCRGMESFRESMLSFCEHDDKQVHQIARNFRDKWIPRPFRRLSCLERDEGRVEFHRGSTCNRILTSQNHWRDQGMRTSEAIDCVMQSTPTTTSVDSTVGCSTPCTASCSTDAKKIRKRKSRWDQPAKTNADPSSLQRKEQKIDTGRQEQLQSVPLTLDSVQNHRQQDNSVSASDGMQNHEDAPPGFSSPVNTLPVSSHTSSNATDVQQNFCHLKCPSDVVTGHPQGKFRNCLPVSYGIPLPIVRDFGSPHADTIDGWAIAPGMPFHPFPPLPPYPRETKDTSACAASSSALSEPVQQGQLDNCGPATCYLDENSPNADLSNTDFPGGNIQQPCKRVRVSSHDLSRRYFRQQKWNKPKFGPPWLRRRQMPGYMGNNSRGGNCGMDVGDVTNELSSYCSQDMTFGVENPGNDFYQHPHQQNHH